MSIGFMKFSISCLIAASLTVMLRGEYSMDSPHVSYSEIPRFDERFKAKCMKNSQGQASSYDNVLAAENKMKNGRKEILNITKPLTKFPFTEMQKEELQDMLVKFCERLTKLTGLKREFEAALEVCLDESEKDFLKSRTILEDASLKFMCHKQGNDTSLFFETGGPACIFEKEGTITASLDSFFKKYSKLSKQKEVMPPIKLGEQECQGLYKVQMDVVKELKTCPDPTPAIIIESQIDEALKDTPCGCLNPKPEKRGPGCGSQNAA